MNALISTRGITKSFAGLKVLQGINLEVSSGELLGLIGPNGAGKTTFFNILNGFLKASSGNVLFEDKRIDRFSPEKRARVLGLGRTFQIPRPFLDLTCGQNVKVALSVAQVPHDERDTRIEELFQQVNLPVQSSKPALELSLLNRKKLELARALALKPKVLLLDEIMSGLNPAEVEEACILVQQLNQQQRMTIIWIEHLVKAVGSIASRLAVLHQGKIIKQGQVKDVLSDAEVIEAYLGEAIHHE